MMSVYDIMGEKPPKPNKKPKRTLDGWGKDSIAEDSVAYQRKVRKLQEDVACAQYDMASFADNMAEWANPTSAEGKARQFNDQYTSYMTQLLCNSLVDGVMADDITEALGMAVAMCVTSKAMRTKLTTQAKIKMYPAMEKRVMNRAAFLDAIDPKAVSRDGMSHQERAEQKLQRRWEKYQAAMNGGRVPLTPESCGTKYIGFCKQYYEQMRIDTPEMADIRKKMQEAKANNQEDRYKRLAEQFKEREAERNRRLTQSFERATNSLKTVARADGISDSDFNKGVLKVYGQISKYSPGIERMFNQTAYGDISKDYNYAVEYTGKFDKNGKKQTRVAQYWDGRFCNKDGSEFTELLTPRKPMTRTGAVGKVKNIYADLYDECKSLDEIAYMQDMTSFQQVNPYLSDILSDDFRASAAAAHQPVDRYVDEIIADGHKAACSQWIGEHSAQVSSQVNREARAASGDKQAQDEIRQEREREAKEKAAAREAREKERHEWAREEHNEKMRQQRLRSQFYRNLARASKNPKFASYFADYAAKNGGSMDVQKISEDIAEMGD